MNKIQPNFNSKTYVVKRDGRQESVLFDKITSRISKLCYGLNQDFVEPIAITMKVITGLYPGVTTVELDNLAAETAASMTTAHPDYAILAARIAISNLHKQTKKIFSEVMEDLFNYRRKNTNEAAPMISEETINIIRMNSDRLNSAIIYDRDFNYNFFGFKTLERSYLLKIDGNVVERPQHLIMRVAIGIHGKNIESVLETYDLMSEKWFTHASPTLFNSGTSRPQMSSCFLLTMKDDSIEGIYDTLKQCALISKNAGGIGFNVHCIRAAGSFICGTNGTSNGLLPMLRVYNNTARYVDQGGNKRPGAFAVYLEPWHADIFDFIDGKKNTGKEENRARDLFYALWIPDLFMRRVEQNKNWTLMCPHECPGLSDCYGEEFDRLYLKYENENCGKQTIPAQKLWFSIIDAQIETGIPFMLYKDACNRKSNQKNLGTIKCSNLCTEIVQYSSSEEIAVCNLASISLPRFVVKASQLTRHYYEKPVNVLEINEAEKFYKATYQYTTNTEDEKMFFDFHKLKSVTKTIVKNLNRIIDRNFYPLEETRLSNMRHRPMGVGVQGLADAFILMGYPFDSDEAAKLNRLIFETIYFGALEMSCELAHVEGPYETYEGSPISQNILQFDMWDNHQPSVLWDWNELREKIKNFGVRNSLLIAPMPTASTAQILGNNEAFEPYTSNVYTRRVLSGEFQIVNSHLLQDLSRLNLWNEEMKNEIIGANGSIQHLKIIPERIRLLYKTVWEISQKCIISMAADRAVYIDQSQSLNIHIAEPNYAKISSMHFYAWKKGLKTGMYYLRTRPAADPIKFTVTKNVETIKYRNKENERVEAKSSPAMEMIESAVRNVDIKAMTPDERKKAKEVCSLKNKEACQMCSG
ncbi:hypothetical protein SNEBB_006101 [Seison nebaliae]|nr:hypothetical protein SNEBB_006101 [Seison nebaliae]